MIFKTDYLSFHYGLSPGAGISYGGVTKGSSSGITSGSSSGTKGTSGSSGVGFSGVMIGCGISIGGFGA